ncbi:unnamed protein product [Kuraishia capsulata CBS 1993]|uniref:Serine/threonine-protein kinase SCH9 n=1 Tax=Kuraishia capsulata CBS 1993 TaxID=1382522 RepID=W6MK33_9ASCO|nr:uncharacterized protein KUCA_T00002650001 [Kuraishia capsulata CBS 1993]CDK26676.1 unnamed protein product [Kuraishia capsulata CBS 1993]
MAEFAKNLFFGNFHQSHEPSQAAGPQPASPQAQDPVSAPESHPGKLSPRLFPNMVQTSLPTTALNDQEFAVGTTIRSKMPVEAAKSKEETKYGSTNGQSGLSGFSSNGLGGFAGAAVPGVNPTNGLNASNLASAPVPTGAQAQAALPRGKLRVTIEEATDLNITAEHSSPYVVVTFQSSESITTGPKSFDSSRPRDQPHRKQLIPRQSTRQGDSFHSHPIWHHQATFDVVEEAAELDISIYDHFQKDLFLGHASVAPRLDQLANEERWLVLEPRILGESVTGKVRVKLEYSAVGKKHYGPNDFDVLRLLGKGTFGQVFQVKKKDTGRIYAMKVLSKKVIVRKKEIAHTIGERDILVRTSSIECPFIVGLKFSFQTPSDLYLVTDYMSGGELFWHLQKEGRFSEDRAKFYIAELLLALEHLHDNDIVYRDLKPENILLDANGHIALCDFGLSKANLTSSNGTTNTFCGTTEYLAPEVLLDESGYTKMVDFWSLGVLIFEMCCGWSPFYADNTQQMYKNIAFGKVRFPKEILSSEGRSFVKGLLNRNPKHRLGALNDARELRAHPFFNDVDWELLRHKKIPPPFIPHLASEMDTSNFDPEFTNTSTSMINKQMMMMLGSTPLSEAIQDNFKGFTYVDDSMVFDHFNSAGKRFPGSFKHPVPASFHIPVMMPNDPNLPAEEEVIEEEETKDEYEDHMDVDDEFVNGQFDL